MSKRRSVILSVLLEGKTQAETARLYDMSEATVSRWIARYRTEGSALFEPKSRRPKTSPNRVSDVVNKLMVNLRVELNAQGLDAGSVTLRHNGRLHHIGIGRPHKHTRIVHLIDNLNIRIINTQTGELLRELTLDPTRDYQPQNARNPNP